MDKQGFDLSKISEVVIELDSFKGKDGNHGKDGYTPIKDKDYFDGKNGKDGKDGHNPIKHQDYFDGKNGKDGVDGYTPIKHQDYFDGARGDDGKDGSSGPTGPRGPIGDDGATPTVEFAIGVDFDRLRINGVIKGPHLTGPEGPEGRGGRQYVVGGGIAVETDPIFTAALDTDNTFSADSDIKVASQKATKSYIANYLLISDKASGVDITAGTNDTKYTTPKGITDSSIIKLKRKYKVVTIDNYTVLDNDNYEIFCFECGPAARTLTLPTYADNVGRKLTIFRADSTSGGSLSIVPEGAETIDGQASIALPKQYEVLVLIAQSGEWIILDKYYYGLYKINETLIDDGELCMFNATSKDIRTSNVTISTTLGVDDTTIPTSKAVKDGISANLVYSETLAADVDPWIISGLDLNAAGGMYEVWLDIKSTVLEGFNMYVNSNTTATNYYVQFIQWNAANHSATYQNNACIGYVPSTEFITVHIMIFLSGGNGTNKKLTARATIFDRNQYFEESYWVCTGGSETNLTSLIFDMSLGYDIKAGSRIKIWKK